MFGCRLAPVSLVSVCCTAAGASRTSLRRAPRSKKGEADEAAYFHKQNIEQLKKMKGTFYAL